MADHKDEKLFTDFPPSTRDEWVNATVKSLKGKPFEKLIKTTYEGFEVQPMYRAEDIEDISHKDTLPGEYPYVRGTKVDGYGAWLIAQEINSSNPKIFNQALKQALERGQTAINIGQHSLLFYEQSHFERAFAGIDLSQYPIFVGADHDAIEVVSLLSAHHDPANLSGCIGYDPLHELARKGKVSTTIYERMVDLLGWASDHAPALDTIAVHTGIYHDAGATAIQELAIAMATGVHYLGEMLDRGLDVDLVAQKMRFFLNIGENFFMEIAKLRAIKMMWAQIVREFGGDETSQKIKIHVQTGDRNKTRYDPYVNMLRVTGEAMAGALGGVDSMHVTPFDIVYGEPDEFSARIARNVQLILQEEVNLVELVDPAGGSWYIEALTDQLTQSAWEFFQQIEAQGGMLAVMQDGFIQAEIEKSADQRYQNIDSRKDILVGTNMYVNLDENLPEIRLDDSFLNPPQYDFDLPDITQATGSAKIKAVIDAFKSGVSRFHITSALMPENAEMIHARKLNFNGLSSHFESLRHRADQHKQTTGKRPQIFLANFGELSQYKARMDFTRGFYEVGGFELLDRGGFKTVKSATQATIDSEAPVVVICSTDEMYTQVVPEFVQTIKGAKPDIVVILAGYPPDNIEEYKQAGVDEFIHLRANCYAMNKDLQDRLGVGR